MISPDTSTMIADLIKHHAQEHTERVDHYVVSPQNGEIHAGKIGNLERHEVSNIVDRVQCHRCLRHQRPGETCWFMWSFATSNFRGGQEAGRACTSLTSSVEETQRGRRFGKSAESQNTQEQEIAWIPRSSTLAERSWFATSKMSHIKCACTNKDLRSPIWKNLSELQMRPKDTVVQTNQDGGSNTVKTNEHPEYKPIV